MKTPTHPGRVKIKGGNSPITVVSVDGHDLSDEGTAPSPANVQDLPATGIPATLATSDSKYVYIPASQLPSQGVFYPYDDLSIRKMNYLDLKKMCRAQATKSFRTMVEVIAATVDRPVMQMTSGDFWYLMYWHRINSYLTSPMTIEYKCSNPEHLEAVEEGHAAKETLVSLNPLTKTSVSVKQIDDIEELTNFITTTKERFNGLMLYPPRVCDILESADLLDNSEELQAIQEQIAAAGPVNVSPALQLKLAEQIEAKFDEEWMHDSVSCISPKYGETLVERLAFFERFVEENGYGFELFEAIRDFTQLYDHGVKETVKSQCLHCKAPVAAEVATDALTFFPALY